MSWNNSAQAPNWAGIKSINANNNTSNVINADLANISSINTNNISSGTAFISSINNSSISQLDASRWSFYKANHDVEATLLPPDPIFPLLLPRKQYDIKDFRDLYIRNVIASADNSSGGGIFTGNTGNIGIVNSAIVNSTEKVSVGIASSKGLIEVDGVDNLVGFNALSVTGGVNLDGGGTVHGITMGTQPFGGVNTIRLEVLPAGIFMNTALFPIEMASGSAVSINAAGAANVAAGGALSLAGGSYIEYNSDQHYFINTSAGNDFTDIYVGNIHPATGGNAPLNINGNRGVTLDNVKYINLFSDASRPSWNNTTTYRTGDIVTVGANYYFCFYDNVNLNPSVQIPMFVLSNAYLQNEFVFEDESGTYRAKSNITVASNLPSADTAQWLFIFNAQDITRVWEPITPNKAAIVGDAASSLLVGTVSTNNLASAAPSNFINVSGYGFQGVPTGYQGIKNFNYITLKQQEGNDPALQFVNNVDDVVAQVLYGTDGNLQIQSDGGIVINSTFPSYTTMSNVKRVILTSDPKPIWDSGFAYSSGIGNEVEYQGSNWASQLTPPRVNRGNQPGAVAPGWGSGATYYVGSVVFDDTAPTPSQYYCIVDIPSSTLEPHLDTDNWEFLDYANDPENIWYPYPRVESSIVGDRLSKITIGSQDFVNAFGTYITIKDGDPEHPERRSGNITSDGVLGFFGTNGAVFGAATGDCVLTAVTGNISAYTDTGGISYSAGNQTSITSGQGTAIVALNGGTNIRANNGGIVIDTQITGGITLNSVDTINLNCANNFNITPSAGNVTINATGLDALVDIGSYGNTTITSYTGKVIINSELDNVEINPQDGYYLKTLQIATNRITDQASGLTIDAPTSFSDNPLSDITNIFLTSDGGLVQAANKLTLNATLIEANADIQQTISRFAIPGTTNYAYLRYIDSAFSQSLDNGSTWTPIATPPPAIAYGDFFANTIQPIATVGVPQDVVFGGYNVKLNTDYSVSYINVFVTGWYEVTFGGYIFAASGMPTDVRMWLALYNGTVSGNVIPYSLVGDSLSAFDSFITLSKTMMVYLEQSASPTSYIGIKWSSNQTSTQLKTIDAIISPYNIPAGNSAFLNLRLIKAG